MPTAMPCSARLFHVIRMAGVAALLAFAVGACGPGGRGGSEGSRYRTDRPVHPDGTGRFYMGREIARLVETEHSLSVGARPDRDVRELPDRLVASLGLKPSDVVADIGAGEGYYTLRLARMVPHGRVLAVDLLIPALDSIAQRAAAEGLRNVQTVLGSETDPGLPDGRVDLALIVVSYHEFTHPYEMITGIARSLAADGRIVVIEYRGEDETIDVPDVHRMTAGQIVREMEAAGLELRQTRDVLPQQHMLEFTKRAERPGAEGP